MDLDLSFFFYLIILILTFCEVSGVLASNSFNELKKKKYINFKRQQKWDTHEITITAVGSLHINSTGGGCTISKFGRKDWQISNMIVIYNMWCIENNDLKK